MKKSNFFCTLFVTTFLIIGFAATAFSGVVSRNVSYEDNDVKLKGYLAWDDSLTGRRPGVLVVHEWWGLNDYARSRARQLAELGYVSFALDMYGQGKSTQHPEQASEWMKQINQNVEIWRERAKAGLEVLKNNEHTDPGRLAAIGYCFGGATVQQMAYGGLELEGVVSFHGSLIEPPENASDIVKAAILICHGAADPFAPSKKVFSFLDAINGSGLDWQMIFYGGAKHSFTNPGADEKGMAALAYDPLADKSSWSHMKLFLTRVFQKD